MRIRLLASLIILAFWAGMMTEINAAPQPGANIAKKRFFRSNLIANYALTRDRLDNIQLTDGKYATNSCMWLDKKTVGWSGVDKLILTFDLGKDQAISGLSYSTAAGSAGVKFPTAIQVSVGTSRSEMHDVGNLITLSERKLNNNQYNATKLVIKNLKTHGRYVRFTILDARYVFIDEIEIYAGKPEWTKLSYDTEPAIDMSQPEGLALFKVRQRLDNDLRTIKALLDKSTLSIEQKDQFKQQLLKLKIAAHKFKFPGNIADFKAIIPFSPIQEKLLAIHAVILRHQGFAPLTIWHKYRYAPLSIWEQPTKTKLPTLSVRMMQNEHRAEVLNLTNTTDQPMKLEFKLTDLPQAVELRQVKYVDTRELKITATALTLLKADNRKNYTIEIPAGLTQQLWFTVNSANIKPGTYHGAIKISVPEQVKTSVPFNITVANLKFPTQPSLNSFVFDYASSFSYGINSTNRDMVIKDMQSHLVNVPVGNTAVGVIPNKNDFDANGKLVNKLDFSKFERWRQRWPNATHLFIYFGITEKRPNFAGFKPGTLEFNHAMAAWAKAWDDYLQSKSIEPGKIVFHFLDEPHSVAAYKITGAWINAFKAHSRYIKMFNDPNKLAEHFNLAKKAFKQLDIICPLDFRYRNEYSKSEIDYLQTFVANPKQALWFYMCFGPSRHFDPSYYRLQPWSAAKVGATGSGFWSYSDQRCDNPWNEYYKTGIRSFGMVYLDKNSVTPTKHWEAFREGIEDYEYLQMLKKSSPTKAKQLITTTVDKTLKLWKPYNVDWLSQNPGKYVEQTRLKILDLLSTE